MDRTLTFLAGAGLGAGLMYLLDPQAGRRRRALIRDQAVSLAHQAQDAAGAVAEDAANRAQGLASGDLTVLVGGKRGLTNFFQGRWSPTARALMGLAGTGLFAFGLTRRAPEACVLGTVGACLVAEGLANANLADVARVPGQVGQLASDAAGGVAGTLGLGGGRRTGDRRPARAGA
jgi:hypothetical protein